MTLHDELFKILVDFGEFAREQDMVLQPTNSIHPTIRKTSALFQQELHTAIEEERASIRNDLARFKDMLLYIDDADPKFIDGYNQAIHAIKEVGLLQLLAKYSPSDKETDENNI